MNLLPFVGFYYRQHAAISQLAGSDKDNRALKLLVNLVHANIPVIKKTWPGHDDLLDDFQKTLDEASYDTLTKEPGKAT